MIESSKNMVETNFADGKISSGIAAQLNGAGHHRHASVGSVTATTDQGSESMTRFLVVIVLLWSATVQAATDRDLFAAYCLGVVRAAIAAPLPYVGGLPPSAQGEAVENNRGVVARMREAEEHLRRYLLARDPADAGILFALKSGENDQKTMTERAVDNHCFSALRCPKIDEPCITACRMEDPLYAKLSKCSDVGKLLAF
jgi:hypothetical protein